MSSRRYRVDQELEIYNFRVVPDLQISKKVYFLMIYVFFLRFAFTYFLGFCLAEIWIFIEIVGLFGRNRPGTRPTT